jgi:hypothetical protein
VEASNLRKECKNEERPGKAACYKSKILKKRSFEKEPLLKDSEKRKIPVTE